MAPIARGGVTAGSNAGVCSRITGHHASGTGGAIQRDGSERSPEKAGITIVPAAPTALRSACTTAGAPPAT